MVFCNTSFVGLFLPLGYRDYLYAPDVVGEIFLCGSDKLVSDCFFNLKLESVATTIAISRN